MGALLFQQHQQRQAVKVSSGTTPSSAKGVKRRRVVKRDPNKPSPKAWSAEEVEQFKRLIEQEGPGGWEQKSVKLGGVRSAKALHTRWLREQGRIVDRPRGTTSPSADQVRCPPQFTQTHSPKPTRTDNFSTSTACRGMFADFAFSVVLRSAATHPTRRHARPRPRLEVDPRRLARRHRRTRSVRSRARTASAAPATRRMETTETRASRSAAAGSSTGIRTGLPRRPGPQRRWRSSRR